MKRALATADFKTLRALALLLILASVSADVFAQEESKPEVLVKGIENGWLVAGENKFSEVDDRFANFVGVYGGWLINHRFLLGGGAYGKTNRVPEMPMGYGGLVLEYFFNPNRLVNFSIKGLIGGGGVSSWWWSDGFFVAEPEVRITVNFTERFRLGFGGGYRFVEGACRDDRLSGYTISVSGKFGAF